jgi:sortase A
VSGRRSHDRRGARGGRVRVIDLVEWLLLFVLVATSSALAARTAARTAAQRADHATIERWRAQREPVAEARAGATRPVLPADRATSVPARPGRERDDAPASLERPAPAGDVPRTRTWRPVGDGPLGIVSIPRVGLEATVRDGADDETLAISVGRIPGTSRSATRGNIGLAAHRDTHFRPLRHVRNGDIVQLETQEGTFEYAVTDIRVVDPEDVWVLDPTERPSVTLVTCYPFNFVGSAPRRFIVRAERAR